MVNFDDVRKIALALPRVNEGTWYGTPGFLLGRKGFARLRGPDVLVLRIDEADKLFLIESQPDVYFTTAHYAGYPAVLLRMNAIEHGEMRRVLHASWRYVARIGRGFYNREAPLRRRSRPSTAKVLRQP